MKRILVVAACLLSASAGAQDFPTKTVSIIVPNPPGGSIDVVARVFADGLQKLWGGKPVIVEYKPGAGTMVGMDYVAK
ncbi:MAG TPA: tripartite tricarboxylate transporter substrate binding protein, partial [Burkholderiales bacterium]|nr:tripartite tricarboxylate transporter substrate binding protein [Burkholderiales bacterium]